MKLFPIIMLLGFTALAQLSVTFPGLVSLVLTNDPNAVVALNGTNTPSTNTNAIYADFVIYGATSGGVTAACAAARSGHSVALIDTGYHIGGMSSGGLSATDIGNLGTSYIGGEAGEFYTRCGTYDPEPHKAESVFWDMINASFTNGGSITVYSNQYITSVTKSNTTLTVISTTATNFVFKFWADTSYENDLSTMSGCTVTVGREGTNKYNETAAVVSAGVTVGGVTLHSTSPYINGALIIPSATNQLAAPGSADGNLQSYNFRICLTQTASNMVAFYAPTNYNRTNYYAVYAFCTNTGVTLASGVLMFSPIANGKFDCNNNASAFMSSDYVGQSLNYLTNGWSIRSNCIASMRDYDLGLLYFLANDTWLTNSILTNMASYGLCKDEFIDTGNFPALSPYVREGNRLVSDSVVTFSNVNNTLVPTDSIGLAAYATDRHECQYICKGTGASGRLLTEGEWILEYSPTNFWKVPYRSVIPKTNDCVNGFSGFGISASSVAFQSYRMEPPFMMIGESIGRATHICISSNWTVHGLVGNYSVLSNELAKAGQNL